MREDTKRRLERALLLERMKIVGSGLAVTAAVGSLLWFVGLDASVESRTVPGVVTTVGPLTGTGATATATGYAVDVKLADGRVAHVLMTASKMPSVGERVEITEQLHGTGRSTFVWPAPQPGAPARN